MGSKLLPMTLPRLFQPKDELRFRSGTEQPLGDPARIGVREAPRLGMARILRISGWHAGPAFPVPRLEALDELRRVSDPGLQQHRIGVGGDDAPFRLGSAPPDIDVIG